MGTSGDAYGQRMRGSPCEGFFGGDEIAAVYEELAAIRLPQPCA
jgi:hypothetical protein